jgi:iron complex outermembrane receptor protein
MGPFSISGSANDFRSNRQNLCLARELYEHLSLFNGKTMSNFNIKMAGYLLLLFLIVPALTLFASDNYPQLDISGTVIDVNTKEPVAFANVYLPSEKKGVATDENGNFALILKEKSSFPVLLRISHISYRTLTKTISESEVFSKLSLTFELQPGSEMHSPVTVMAHRVHSSPNDKLNIEQSVFLPIDSGQFLREAGNLSGVRKGGFGIDPVLRGLQGSRLNIRLDGLTTTAAACPNRMDPPTSHIRLSDIERVEIYRGPHALEYGPSFGGTINFVKQKPEPYTSLRYNGDLNAGLESNTGHRKTDLRLRSGTQLWNVLLSGGISATDNYQTGNETNVPGGFESYDYGVDVGVNVSESHRLTANWSQSFIRDADYPALMMDMAIDDTYKFKGGYSFDSITKNYISGISVDGYWSLVDHEMNNHSRSSFAMRDAVALAETETFGGKISLNGLHDSGTWTVKTNLDVQNVDGTRYVDIKMGPMAGNSMTYNLWQDVTVFNTGLYSGIDYIVDEWTFSGGLRLDLNIADSDNPAPRYADQDINSEHLNFSISLGATKPLNNTTTLGFFVGRGVRSPDVTERYLNYLTIGRDGYEYAGNPTLDPEINNQLDVVLNSDLGKFSIESTIFASYMMDYISATVNPEIQPVGMDAPGVREFENRGDAVFMGFEASVSYSIDRKYFATLNSSYTGAEYTNTNSPVAEIPPLEAGLILGGSFFDDMLTPEVAVRRVFPQTRFDESFGESRTPGFWLTDLTFRSAVFDQMLLSYGVRNIFDEAYYEHLNRRFNPGVNPSGDVLLEPGRRFFVEISVGF